MRRRPFMPPVGSVAQNTRAGTNRGLSLSPRDFIELSRIIDRKKRAVLREGLETRWPLPADYYVRMTWSSFRIDGMDVTELEADEALGDPANRPALRSRSVQRLRNHSAILHHIERDIKTARPLSTATVMRWYTTISAGLSTTSLDQATTFRVDEQVRRMNSPELRLQAAISDMAQSHVRLLADPLVPSFNGILARLLLRFQLGRCGLPAIVFNPPVDQVPMTVDQMTRRLIELLESSFESMAGTD